MITQRRRIENPEYVYDLTDLTPLQIQTLIFAVRDYAGSTSGSTIWGQEATRIEATLRKLYE